MVKTSGRGRKGKRRDVNGRSKDKRGGITKRKDVGLVPPVRSFASHRAASLKKSKLGEMCPKCGVVVLTRSKKTHEKVCLARTRFRAFRREARRKRGELKVLPREFINRDGSCASGVNAATAAFTVPVCASVNTLSDILESAMMTVNNTGKPKAQKSGDESEPLL